MKILISTTKRPRDTEHAAKLFAIIREEVEAQAPGCSINSFYWTTGPGCYNLVIDFAGPVSEATRLADVITLTLMPAKWTVTTDDIPPVDTCDGIFPA